MLQLNLPGESLDGSSGSSDLPEMKAMGSGMGFSTRFSNSSSSSLLEREKASCVKWQCYCEEWSHHTWCRIGDRNVLLCFDLILTLLFHSFNCISSVFFFLGATKDLCKRVCPSVRQSVCPLSFLIEVFRSTLCRVSGIVTQFVPLQLW